MYIEKFIDYIQFEKRYSPNTITAYKNDLSQFGEYLLTNYQIKQIEKANYQMIRSWIVYLVEQNDSNVTINRKLSTLKSFYRYLLRNEVIKENPMIKITAPKANKKLPEFVGKVEMDHLFEDVDFDPGFLGLRDKLLIEMLYFTGMRLSELIHIKDADIDLQNQRIKVLGKRNKERIIPFSLVLKNSINRYLEIREKEMGDKEQNSYFFVTEKGKKVYEKLVYRTVNSYLSRVSTLRKKSPHVLRHTFATHMLNNGADLNAIKELLGHANLAATQVYTHNTIDQLKSIYKQAHPRA
jgi:integrase/recombinase XerC